MKRFCLLSLLFSLLVGGCTVNNITSSEQPGDISGETPSRMTVLPSEESSKLLKDGLSERIAHVDFCYASLEDILTPGSDGHKCEQVWAGEIVSTWEEEIETKQEVSCTYKVYDVYRLKILDTLWDDSAEEAIIKIQKGIITRGSEPYYERWFEVVSMKKGEKILAFTDSENILCQMGALMKVEGKENDETLEVRGSLLPFFEYQKVSGRSLPDISVNIKLRDYLQLLEDYLRVTDREEH